MEKIKKYLLDSKFDLFYDENDTFEGINEFLHILILKKENGEYLVRNAILCHFDRWANSGCEFTVKTEDEVIEYFSDSKCMIDSISELVEGIVEDSVYDNDDNKMRKAIDFLYVLMMEELEEERRCVVQSLESTMKILGVLISDVIDNYEHRAGLVMLEDMRDEIQEAIDNEKVKRR